MAQQHWSVRGTKKGALPVAVEKRTHHKVTVIKNVTNPALLASALQKALGTGGSVSPNGDVEVQGQLVRRVERFLKVSGNLNGVSRPKAPKPTTAEAAICAAASDLATTRALQAQAAARRGAAGKPRQQKALKVTKLIDGAFASDSLFRLFRLFR